MEATSPVAERYSTSRPDRNLALELVRVTEAAALGAARWVGRGDKEKADAAAVESMRRVLDTVPMDGTVIIGEGEKDEAPMLYNGERVGDGHPPAVDVAVDPLEGTTLCALGQPNALTTIAVGPTGSFFDPGPCVYMEKIAGPARIADLLDLDRPLGETLRLIAARRECEIGDIVVVMLDRPRHRDAMAAIRGAGARLHLISHGDVSAAIHAAEPNEDSIDLMWGIGGTPEGVLSAAAIKCLGGQILGRLWPRNDGEANAARDAGYDLGRVLDVGDLARGDDIFFACTGVTDGDLLQGVHYQGAAGATTHSLVMRTRTGTVREMRAHHDRDRLRKMGVHY